MFKRTQIADFFLNEEHPYSKVRTLKMLHVGVLFGAIVIFVLILGTVFDDRAKKTAEEVQAAKEAKRINPSQAAGASPPPSTGGGFLSLRSSYTAHSASRERSATQIIKRGENVADVLPIGTMIHAELIGRVESVDSNSPVTAVLLEDALSPVQALVIPKGTKVIGSGQLDAGRERLQVRFHTLVFPEGEQYGISGLASMPDGSSGLVGDFSSGAFKKNVSQFVGSFVGGLAEGMKDRTAVGQIGIPFEPGSLKNGVLSGVSNSSMNYAKTQSEQMGQGGASIKVPGGTRFNLYFEKEFHQ